MLASNTHAAFSIASQLTSSPNRHLCKPHCHAGRRERPEGCREGSEGCREGSEGRPGRPCLALVCMPNAVESQVVELQSQLPQHRNAPYAPTTTRRTGLSPTRMWLCVALGIHAVSDHSSDCHSHQGVRHPGNARLATHDTHLCHHLRTVLLSSCRVLTGAERTLRDRERRWRALLGPFWDNRAVGRCVVMAGALSH